MDATVAKGNYGIWKKLSALSQCFTDLWSEITVHIATFFFFSWKQITSLDVDRT